MNDRQDSLRYLEQLAAKPAGGQALRLSLHTVSSFIPGLSGLAAGTISLQAEMEQQQFNEGVINWAQFTDDQLTQLVEAVRQLTQEPNEASLSLLLGELFGDEIAMRLCAAQGNQIAAILNPSTVSELEPYINLGLIAISSTGSQCSMGANNQIGGHIEERKRPYGMGSGFIITVNLNG
ncbi:TPA: hypothetical protein ACGUPD_001917 [Vibrio vulnificus]|nr:hypothetical protein [Vibrio vulnificus]HDY7560212.1 hypothetical protein [Vibrio vulnificus]